MKTDIIVAVTLSSIPLLTLLKEFNVNAILALLLRLILTGLEIYQMKVDGEYEERR